MNRENDLNLTFTEPPIKRFKRELEKISSFEHENVSITSNLAVQLQDDFNTIESPIKESSLDKWRKSFQTASSTSILSYNCNRNADESEMEEIAQLSDDFFNDSMEKDQFDFDLSDLDQELFFESITSFESNKPFHRIKVLKATESFYIIEGSKFQNPQKIVECLLIENDLSNIDFPLKVYIRGDWLHCKIEEESIINVIGPIKNGEIVIDDEKNYLVIEPDILINTTGIADSFTCMRRAVLSYKNQTAVEDNKPSSSLIIGSIVHELVEDAFKTGIFKEINESDPKLNHLIIQNIEKIFCCEKDEKFVKEKVLETMKNFPKWCMLYIRNLPAIHAYVQDPIRKSSSASSTDKATICLSKILDLEENIWSVMFGLKGKVDATVVMKSKNNESLIVPFELKTGQSTTSVNHRAQTLLYTLMLNDRYKRQIDYGLLFYITTGDLMRISSFRDEIRSILIKRNQLAEQLKGTITELPPQIRNEHLCKKCFQVETCVMYHKLLEDGCKETSSVPSLFEQKTGHISNEKYEEFLKKWQNLINLEEEETVKNRSELWRFNSKHRSGRGKCLNEMKMIKSEPMRDSNNYLSTFIKNVSVGDQLIVSLLNSYLNEGDPVTISCETDENVHYALSTGKIVKLTSDFVTIQSDRAIKVPEVTDDFEAKNSSVLFCIDKNELTGSFGLLRASLIKLFSVECQKLLSLIVDQVPPKYLPREQFNEDVLKTLDPKYGMLEDYHKMDEYQKESFFRSIETIDYLLILGMPGTGKTTTLAFIIRYLVLILGKSVLISSHTHSAIDHIALKLQERNLPFLRIGVEDKIDKRIHEGNLLEGKKFSTVSEVEHVYSSARVVICTSLGINHSIFMRKRFDFCIIDEASQLTLPSCLGALRLSQSFLLVGDHYQLPPLVRSRDALKGGFGESLFKILAETHPQAMSKLCFQYRMNDDIMLMANRLTYQNLLKCACPLVRDQVLNLKSNSNDKIKKNWLKKILDPQCKVVFLNTDDFGEEMRESVNGNSFHNEGESNLIKEIVNAFITCGVDPNQISLISPYRPQLKYLTFNVSDTSTVSNASKGSNASDTSKGSNAIYSNSFPHVSTIDKYQGKDSDLIIISLVRSNPNGNIGELLNDWQRLNVAFTRAKKKLILVGSVGTVLNNPSFKKLKELIEEQGWLLSGESGNE